jgi:hypothetical protein
MAKKTILAFIIIIFIGFSALFMINSHDTVDVYLDGENVSVETKDFGNGNLDLLNQEICDYVVNVMDDTTTNITGLHDGIENICQKYGMDDTTVNIDSSIGPDQIPVMVYVDGTSMVPTLQDGQTVLYNKTHDVHVGDIVVAESDEYGGIIKRVDAIDGNRVHLISDNKEVTYEYIDGDIYETKGITTWVDISDINGVVIDY